MGYTCWGGYQGLLSALTLELSGFRRSFGTPRHRGVCRAAALTGKGESDQLTGTRVYLEVSESSANLLSSCETALGFSS